MKRILSLLACGLTSLTAVGAAADTTTPDRVFGHWVMHCIEMDGSAKACALHQRLYSDKTKAPVASFAIADNEKGAAHRLTVIMPLGIDIPAGVTGALAGRPALAYQIQTCLPRGCIASVGLTAEDLAALEAARDFTTSFRMRGVADPVTVTVSLKGVTEGLKALAAE